MSAGSQTTFLNAAVTFVKAMADAWNVSGWISDDMKPVNISKVGVGSKQTVEFISVGRVYDTIRSRRNKLLEERVESGDIDW